MKNSNENPSETFLSKFFMILSGISLVIAIIMILFWIYLFIQNSIENSGHLQDIGDWIKTHLVFPICLAVTFRILSAQSKGDFLNSGID